MVKRITIFAASFLIGWLLFMPESVPHNRGAYWITDASIWDGRAADFRPGSLLVKSDRIEQIIWDEPPPPSPAAVFKKSYAGRYIIPGLINAHTHVANSASCVPGEGFRPWTARQNLFDWLHLGYTTVADMGGWPLYMKEIKKWAEEEPALSSRVLMAGPILTVKDGYPANWLPDDAQKVGAIEFATKENLDSVLKNLDLLGVDYVKLALQEKSFGGKDIPYPSQELINDLTESVHEHGKKLFVHALTLKGYESGLIAEVDGFIHVSHESMWDGMAQDLVTRSIPMIPTIWVWKSNWWIPEGNESVAESFRSSQKSSWANYLSEYKKGDNFPVDLVHEENVTKASAKKSHAALIRNLKLLKEAGASFVFGTDSPTCLNPAGAAFQEMRELRLAGFDPKEILTMATSNAARFLGKDADLGVLEVGKKADFVVLAANPFIDFETLQKPVSVIRDGVAASEKSSDGPMGRIRASLTFLKVLLQTLVS